MVSYNLVTFSAFGRSPLRNGWNGALKNSGCLRRHDEFLNFSAMQAILGSASVSLDLLFLFYQEKRKTKHRSGHSIVHAHKLNGREFPGQNGAN